MILLTVGTAHFDPLIVEFDRLVRDGVIRDKVLAQIGCGSYIPQHFRYFRFIKSMSKLYEKAEVIVSTGGAATTLECVKMGRRLVTVENPTLMEGHQAQLIGEMEKRGHLVWCRDLAKLPQCISEARGRTFTPFVSDAPRAHKLILKLLASLE
ncbi:MAG: glycosyltransferase [Candidatus Thorarchaeota archaeon]